MSTHVNKQGTTPEQPRACKTINDVKLGERFVRDYTVTYEDVVKFSEISGDWNPAHHDAEYAKTTIFKEQIAHGMISVAKFSGILGMDYPGLGTIWLGQDVKFLAPVYLNRPYKAVMEVTKVDVEKNDVHFDTWCEDADGNKVLTGSAIAKPIPQKVRDKMRA